MSVDQSITNILRQRRFWGSDPQLARYDRINLVDYISYCCDRSSFIEAYTLALQYAEDLIVLALKRDKYVNSNDAPTIVSILSVVGKIDSQLKGLFEIVNSTRNELVHKVIRNPSI